MYSGAIEKILDEMNELQELLLSISDDIYLSIDNRDNTALEKGTKFLRMYNKNVREFVDISLKIEDDLKKYLGIVPEEGEIEEGEENEERDRIVIQLNKSTPHYLNENFTYKRPYGFSFKNTACIGLKTWRNFYIEFLHSMEQVDENISDVLLNKQKSIWRSEYYFSRNPNKLRYSKKVFDDCYAEMNLSANSIRDNILNIMNYYSIPSAELKIFLREDRDA